MREKKRKRVVSEMAKRFEAITTSGKTKFIELEAKGEYLITRWGLVGSDKVQETKERCEAKNIGKKNFISAEEQALLRLERKIKKKMDEGYVTPGTAKVMDELPDLSALQKYFTPCKPIAKPPKDALTGDYLADRKYNGVNIILVKDNEQVPHVYTRRIDDITEQLYQLDEVKLIFNEMLQDSMLLVELIYEDSNGIEAPEKLRALINKRRSPEAVKERYDEISKTGSIKLIVFDVMFWNTLSLGESDEFFRRKTLLQYYFPDNVPETMLFDQATIDRGKEEGWEGFVLRKLDSKIAYTMNGKAKRTGSWKWKYECTDDFIVVDAEYGRGKHDKYFARFKLAQYDNDGNLVDCGYCGPGKLVVAELEELHQNRKTSEGTYNIEPYMVIEVLFRARASGGIKLEFPVFQRIRDDKGAEECIFNGA